MRQHVFSLLAAVILLLHLMNLAVRATIPAAATNDARYALGYLVVTNYPGVKNDGTGDCTVGLQSAINDAFAANRTFQDAASPINAGRPLVVWLPPGVYRITNVLECYTWEGTNGFTSGFHALVGSTEGGRPKIKLADSSPQYTNSSAPRPMVAFRRFKDQLHQPAVVVAVANPMSSPANYSDFSGNLFWHDLRNIDFDCGNNAGAVGVVFAGAQFNSLENVRVYATNAFAGFYQLPGAGACAANLEVYGGRYGVIHGKYSSLALNIDSSVSGPTIVGVTLQDQTVAPVCMLDTVATITICGFQFLNSKSTVVQHYGAGGGSTLGGSITLLDGQISMNGSGNPIAIINTNVQCPKSLYLRDIYVTNTINLVLSGATITTGTGAWKRIVEYSYNNPKDVAGVPPNSGYPLQEDTIESWSMVNGVVRDIGTEFPVSPAVSNNCEAPPSDLVTRHLWTTLPSYNNTNETGVCVSTGAGYNNTNDDTLALQAAIDSARSAGHSRVFLPAGNYFITNTLTLHSNTVLMGAGRGITRIEASQAWKPTSGEATMLLTEDAANGTATLAWLTVSGRRIGSSSSETNYSRFNPINWQVGRNSMLVGICVPTPYVYNNHGTQPRSLYKFTGHGGGRVYGLAAGGGYGENNPAFRAVKIDRTTEPLWFYGFNIETKGTGDMGVEVSGASNVRMLGMKREGYLPMLVITNSTNIAAYSAGSMIDNPAGNGFFQVRGNCTNVLMANLNVQCAPGGEGSSDFTVYEAITGQPVTNVLHPNSVSLYKRGELDDTVMIIGGGGATATNSFRVQAISSGPPLTVSVLSSSNRVYTLWSSAKLPPVWTPVPGQVGIPGNGESLELRDTNTSPAQFYRVSVAN